MRLVYLDLASLVGDRPIAQLVNWIKLNPFAAGFVPVLLATEAVVLYGLKLSSAQMAGSSAFFCFMSLMWFTYAWSIGHDLRTTSDTGEARKGRISEHVGYTNWMAVCLLMGVVAIECAIRQEGGQWGPTWLKAIHFVFVFCAVVAYGVARFVLTGIVKPERHRVWVRILGMSYATTLVTGTSLILWKFPLS